MSKKNQFKRKKKIKSPDKKFKGIFLKLLLIAVLGLIIYSNTFTASWHLDDFTSIVNNDKIKNIPKYLIDIIYNSRGICDLSFAINYYINGLNVFSYHLINLAIHIISSLMVFLLIRLTLFNLYSDNTSNLPEKLKNLPFIGSLLFLAHPVQTQAVTYIVQRYTSLTAMFYLMALIFFIKARMSLVQNNNNFFSKHHFSLYLCSFACTLLAMRTKEIAVTIPIIFFLYDFIFLKKKNQWFKSTLLYLLPFFILLLIILALRVLLVTPDFTELGESIGKSFEDSKLITRTEYGLTSLNVVFTYIRLLFFPVNQNIYYTYPISTSIFSHYTYLSLLLHTAIIIFAVAVFRKSRLISFGILWFYITLSVESSIVPIKDVIFEHRLYLPSVGFVIFVTGLVLLKVEWGKIFYNSLLVVIAILSVATYNRNFVWKDEYSLWNDSLLKSKSNFLAYFNLGVYYLDNKLYDKSIEKFKKALEINPYLEGAHNNLGNCYEKKGLLDMALYEFKAAVKIKPDYPEAHNNLGYYYEKKGLLDMALYEFKAAVKIKPAYFLYHNNLRILYYKLGRVSEGLEEFKIATRLNPGLNAQDHLGSAYYDQGELDQAISKYQKALKLNPNAKKVYIKLGLAFFEKGDVDRAIKEYKNALQIEPDFFEGHLNLGNSYFVQARLDEAIKEYQAALKLNPYFTKAHYHLGLAYFKKGKIEEATNEFQVTLKIDPSFPSVHNSMGLIYFTQGKFKEAIKELKEALKLKPDYYEAHFNLGNVYYNQGRLDDAVKEYEATLKIKPAFIEARQALESILRK